MAVRLFVGNLPYDATEAELRELFGSAGALTSVHIPMDRETGRPRGFAFVEYDDRGQAEAAINRFNGQLFKGRPMAINEARARGEAPPPRTGGFGGPRPSGPGGFGGPRPGGFSGPRPGGFGGGGGRFGAPPPEDENRARNFGPDAPPRNKRKVVKKEPSDRSPKLVPKERGGGKYYGHFDTEEWDDSYDDLKEIDNIATREEDEEGEDLKDLDTPSAPERDGDEDES